jgi:hypothetical protein
LALGRGRILILRFIRSSLILAIYDVAHTLSLGVAGCDISFAEDEIQRHFSYFFGNFRELISLRFINE